MKKYLFLLLISFNGLTQAQELDNALVNEIAQINKQTPVMVSKNVRLDKVVVQGQHINYEYTDILTTAQKVTAGFSEAMFNGLSPRLSKICVDPKFSKYLKQGVTLSFNYQTTDGVRITQINITANNCGYNK